MSVIVRTRTWPVTVPRLNESKRIADRGPSLGRPEASLVRRVPLASATTDERRCRYRAPRDARSGPGAVGATTAQHVARDRSHREPLHIGLAYPESKDRASGARGAAAAASINDRE